MMDYCKNCIRKSGSLPPGRCPECGAAALKSELSGPCMHLCCSRCGYEVVGSGFYPQCYLDNAAPEKKYTVSIAAAEKSQYLTAARIFGINTVQLKHILDSGKTAVRMGLTLYETADLMHLLQQTGLPCLAIPDPLTEYPEILKCPLR